MALRNLQEYVFVVLYNNGMWITLKKRKSQQSYPHNFADLEIFPQK